MYLSQAFDIVLGSKPDNAPPCNRRCNKAVNLNDCTGREMERDPGDARLRLPDLAHQLRSEIPTSVDLSCSSTSTS